MLATVAYIGSHCYEQVLSTVGDSAASIWNSKCFFDRAEEHFYEAFKAYGSLCCFFCQRARSEYKTYSWQEIKPPNSLWDSRIKKAVDAQLTAKGWRSIKAGGNVAIVAPKVVRSTQLLLVHPAAHCDQQEPKRVQGFLHEKSNIITGSPGVSALSAIPCRSMQIDFPDATT
jgi:hypothetical protein